MQLDNHDERIHYYELILERALDDLPQYCLPEGYRFAFYQPGDELEWMEIERSAKEFDTLAAAREGWNRYYGGKEETLRDRMLFIEDESGRKVATATAYYDIYGRDKSGDAWLHWVAVRRDSQGRGLSKPLVARALRQMTALGYRHAKVPTQTTSWVACKVYLDLGFRPLPENAAHSHMGWRIVRTLTEHPALRNFAPVAENEILKVASDG